MTFSWNFIGSIGKCSCTFSILLTPFQFSGYKIRVIWWNSILDNLQPVTRVPCSRQYSRPVSHLFMSHLLPTAVVLSKTPLFLFQVKCSRIIQYDLFRVKTDFCMRVFRFWLWCGWQLRPSGMLSRGYPKRTESWHFYLYLYNGLLIRAPLPPPPPYECSIGFACTALFLHFAASAERRPDLNSVTFMTCL